MIKRILKPLSICLVGGLFLYSCSGEATSNTDDVESENLLDTLSESVVENDDVVQEFDNQVLESESIPNTDWQINNYANHLIGENIASSAETADNDNGNYWYYQTLDVKGGFASVTGAVEGWKEFVVWRMEDGDDLVGEMTVGCGPACDYQYTFYKGRGAEIEEYSENELFPMDELNRHKTEMIAKIIAKYPVDYPEDSQLIYNFPQKGTGMRVDVNIGADEIQVPIAQLAWDKSLFYIDEFFHSPDPLLGE